MGPLSKTHNSIKKKRTLSANPTCDVVYDLRNSHVWWVVKHDASVENSQLDKEETYTVRESHLRCGI